jgi:hypothetical protein
MTDVASSVRVGTSGSEGSLDVNPTVKQQYIKKTHAVSHELARSATSKGLAVVETSIATTAEIMNLAAVL